MNTISLLPKRAERDPAASLALRTLPDPVLRLVCEPVDTFDRPFRELVEEMRQLMLRHRGSVSRRRRPESPCGCSSERSTGYACRSSTRGSGRAGRAPKTESSAA